MSGRSAIVVGDVGEHAGQDVSAALRAAGATTCRFVSMRQAQVTRGALGADLALIVPALDGSHPCAQSWQLRAAGFSSRILMLLAAEHDALLPPGVLAGADDVSLAPIRALDVTRRAVRLLARPPEWPLESTAGPVTVSWKLRRVTWREGALDLTRTEYALLAYLVHRRDLVRWDELGLVVLGTLRASPARAVAPHLAALRRKLGSQADVIETVHGVGCRVRDSDRATRPSGVVRRASPLPSPIHNNSPYVTRSRPRGN